MKRPLSFAELRTMSSERREHQLARILAQARQPNGEIKAVQVKIAAFEAQYECSSEEMRARFADGQNPETPDISAWMMLLDLRDKVAGAGSASPG